MTNKHIASQIYNFFKFEPTFGQKKIIENLSSWLISSDLHEIFILNGYAGTGKTTIISAFVNAVKYLNINVVLLAPTGRAAKVVSRYSKQRAYTIHKKIYRQKKLSDLDSEFSIDFNKHKDTIFIVDEASMLSNYSSEGSFFGSGSLLDDLVKYVRQGERCRLMFVGDSAQLPPVGHSKSPALDEIRMQAYGTVNYNTLDDVVRQSVESGILFNATMIRCMLEAGIEEIPIFEMNYPDMFNIEGGEFMEAVEDNYSKYGKDEVLVITRSNKRANKFNEGIRRYVMYAEEMIESGDMLMIVKNNYHCTAQYEDCPMEFIANGDVAYLRRIRSYKDLYGFHFAEATLVFDDYESTELECKVILDTLSCESPSLTREQSRNLFYSVEEDYQDLKTKKERYKAVREDEYFNAVQVKFAYAVTCHKAQGGQWKSVFIDRMLFGDEQMSLDKLQWLYTAMTRAQERVYLVNFDERFF
ncbi:MAG: AAA family ATPase [Rikenellaceae bacterium]